MFHYKQVPMLRVAAKKALEEGHVSLEDYQVLMMLFNESERTQEAERDRESKSLAGEWMIKKKVAL